MTDDGWDRLIDDVTSTVGDRSWLRFLRSVVAGAAAGWAPDVERRTLAEFDAFVGEVERLRAAVALHQPYEFGADDLAWLGCAECAQDWPCPTARAASGEGDRG